MKQLPERFFCQTGSTCRPLTNPHFCNKAIRISQPSITTSIGALSQDTLDRLARCEAYVIAGPPTNLSTPSHGQRIPFGPALPGLDLCVTRYASLAPDCRRMAQGGVGMLKHWFEHLSGDVPCLLSLGEGAPLLVAQDGCAYLGGWPDDTHWDHVLRLMAPDLPERLQDGLRLRRTAQHRFLINYTRDEQAWMGRTVPTCDVLIEPP